MATEAQIGTAVKPSKPTSGRSLMDQSEAITYVPHHRDTPSPVLPDDGLPYSAGGSVYVAQLLAGVAFGEQW